jgi:predicted nuclease with TOPRIM domain
MEMDNIILDLLKGMDGKIDRISQDIAIVKIKDVEQAAKLDALEEKFGRLFAKHNAIDERLKKFETEFATKKDVDSLFDKVRTLEEAPQKRIIGKVDFVKKAIIAGLAVLITGAVIFLGHIVWKIIIHFNSVVDAVELLK